MSAPKGLFIFYNLFSLQLTENLHKQKHFLKTRSTILFKIFFSKINNKTFLFLVYGPLKLIKDNENENDFTVLASYCDNTMIKYFMTGPPSTYELVLV